MPPPTTTTSGSVTVSGIDAFAGSSERPSGRAIHLDPVAPEQQQVEVHLARPPSLALLAAEGALEALEGE